MEISLSSNSITDDHIATKFDTCHDSPAVVPCAKYCSDHFISIWMGAKWNFHHIWIVMEKLLVKWAPVQQTITLQWWQIKLAYIIYNSVVTWKCTIVHVLYQTLQNALICWPPGWSRSFKDINDKSIYLLLYAMGYLWVFIEISLITSNQITSPPPYAFCWWMQSTRNLRWSPAVIEL